jgi:hypothetical protein
VPEGVTAQIVALRARRDARAMVQEATTAKSSVIGLD